MISMAALAREIREYCFSGTVHTVATVEATILAALQDVYNVAYQRGYTAGERERHEARFPRSKDMKGS